MGEDVGEVSCSEGLSGVRKPDRFVTHWARRTQCVNGHRGCTRITRPQETQQVCKKKRVDWMSQNFTQNKR